MIVNLCLPSSIQQGQVNKLLTLESSPLQRNLWLLGEECKPIIVCSADENAHICAYFVSGNLAHLRIVKNVAQALTEWLFTFLRTLYIKALKGYIPEGKTEKQY